MSFAELAVEADVGAIPAQKIEAALASFSVLLRDGDPALLRRPPAPEIEEPGPAPDPEQALATCGRALLLLARKVMLDGASLAAIAAQVALDPDNARKHLRVYSRARYGRTVATEVARIAAPILVTSPTETKRRRGRRANLAASAPETGNVVPVVFGAGKAIPK